MRINTDKATNVIGFIGALLILQNHYLPELLPDKVSTNLSAILVSVYAAMTNKKELLLFENKNDNNSRIKELESKIEELNRIINSTFYPEDRDADE